MALAFSNLPKMARLLDEVWDFTPAEFEVWRDAQPEVDHSVCAELERMLKARPGESWQDFLREGPRLHPPSASEENPCRAGDLVGAYRLLREIGRGGMAVVWLGERADGTVKRPVAIKMPLLTVTVSTEADRFSRERDVLAILEHPQIARLYDAGVTLSGRPFIVLEYVDGCPITQACDLRKMGVVSRLRMFLQVLQAVEIAHKHLIVHRDIKPSNVFVDAQNRVKLLDFGIAKLLDASFEGASLQTVEGSGALTPLYAAPEQIGGGVISTATDIYALGVLLYELVTGTLPHAIEGTIADVVQAALHREPIRPSLANMPPAAAAERDAADSACLRSSLSGDLDTIILKALRKSPADRYGTIGHFIDDVERFLADRPIAARPPSFAYVSRLFIKRHRAVAFAAMIGTACALVVGSVALREYFDSVEQRLRGDAVRDFMLDMVEDAEPDEAHADAEPTGRQMIEGAVKRAREDFADQPRLRGELLAALGRVRGRLDEDNAGTPLIEEALVLLEANAPARSRTEQSARACRRTSTEQRPPRSRPGSGAALVGPVHGRSRVREGAPLFHHGPGPHRITEGAGAQNHRLHASGGAGKQGGIRARRQRDGAGFDDAGANRAIGWSTLRRAERHGPGCGDGAARQYAR